MPITLIRKEEAWKIAQRSKSSFYLDIKNGVMVKPVHIGPRSIRFIKEEIEAILNARIMGASEAEIAKTVKRLHDFRA